VLPGQRQRFAHPLLLCLRLRFGEQPRDVVAPGEGSGLAFQHRGVRPGLCREPAGRCRDALGLATSRWLERGAGECACALRRFAHVRSDPTHALRPRR
jgi:hypothetical protein